MDLASIKKFFASLTLQKLVPVILIVVIGLLLVKLLLKLFDRVLERSRLERTMFSFLRAAMRALLYTILVLVAASSLGVDVTSLVAILSVVSLAISLAVQNALSNVVGSVTLLTTHPFHVGDFVEIGSDSGTVEEISVSYTKLATVDGKRIYIPNSDAASARICNYSVEGRRRVDLYIGVSYDAPAEKVREALLAAAQHPKALQDPAPLVVLNNYQDSSIQYLLMLWTASGDYLDVRFAVNEAVKRELDARIRECKDRAAATLGAADEITIGGVTLSRRTTRMLTFSRDECVKRYGSSLYEACKVETSRTTFEITPAVKR